MGLSSIILLSLLLHVSLRGLLASGQNNDIELPYPPINASDGRTPLYFSLIQSFSGQYISALSLPGLQLALDLVNDDESLLPGYSLHYVFTDAPVSAIANVRTHDHLPHNIQIDSYTCVHRSLTC